MGVHGLIIATGLTEHGSRVWIRIWGSEILIFRIPLHFLHDSSLLDYSPLRKTAPLAASAAISHNFHENVTSKWDALKIPELEKWNWSCLPQWGLHIPIPFGWHRAYMKFSFGILSVSYSTCNPSLSAFVLFGLSLLLTPCWGCRFEKSLPRPPCSRWRSRSIKGTDRLSRVTPFHHLVNQPRPPRLLTPRLLFFALNCASKGIRLVSFKLHMWLIWFKKKKKFIYLV